MLIIDDDVIVSRSIARMLASRCVVAIETEARVALERITRGETFDVVLCDLTMPNVSGSQFYEAVVAFDPLLARRIVFMTNGAPSTSARQFLENTANTLLTKPFDLARLRRIVADHGAG